MRSCWCVLVCLVCMSACALPHHAIPQDGTHGDSEDMISPEGGDSPVNDALPDSELADGSDAADTSDAFEAAVDVVDVADATDTPDVLADASDVIDVPDVSDVMDVGPDVMAMDVVDATDATDATDAPADVPIARRTITVVIWFLNDSTLICSLGNYYIRETYPPGFLDGAVTSWSSGHCVGGVIPAPAPAPAGTVQCTLDITSYVNRETVEFYPTCATTGAPVCIDDSGSFCPSHFEDRFTVFLEPSIATYTYGAGLTHNLFVPAAVGGGHTISMSFVVPDP